MTVVYAENVLLLIIFLWTDCHLILWDIPWNLEACPYALLKNSLDFDF